MLPVVVHRSCSIYEWWNIDDIDGMRILLQLVVVKYMSLSLSLSLRMLVSFGAVYTSLGSVLIVVVLAFLLLLLVRNNCVYFVYFPCFFSRRWCN